MARNLYEMGDPSPNQKLDWLSERQERSVQVMPLGILMVALAVGALVIMVLRSVLPAPAPESQAPVTTSIDTRFSACDEVKDEPCVLGPDRYAYQGQVYHLSDISVPRLTEARCPAEAEQARKGRYVLLAMLNGGAFDARPDAADRDPSARMLVRDGVSIGELMILKDYARPWSAKPLDWCAPEVL